MIDTNVIVSAALKPTGSQRTILLLAITKPARLYVTEAIMSGYRAVLARPRIGIPRGRRQEMLQLIQDRARLLKTKRILLVTRDPDDNMFLECADAARADYLITGNGQDFPEFWKKTRIVSLRAFLDTVATHLL